MKVKRILFVIIILIQQFTLSAQEHVIIDFFNGKIFNDQILLNWNIIGGNNCNGIIIYHSTDNIDYKEVGEIPGICGAIVDAEPYSFLHTNPAPNQLNYYKLKLGSQGFTTPLEIMFYKTGTKGFTFYPNPSHDFFRLYVNESNQNPKVEIIDSSGKIRLSQNIVAGQLNEINSSQLSSGNYIIRILDGTTVVSSDKLLRL
jgi:hypothetical protein